MALLCQVIARTGMHNFENWMTTYQSLKIIKVTAGYHSSSVADLSLKNLGLSCPHSHRLIKFTHTIRHLLDPQRIHYRRYSASVIALTFFNTVGVYL